MVGAQLLFKRAAQLAPNDMQALWNLAKFFHRSKHEPGTAEKIYRRMLQNDPCDEVVLSALEELLHEENRLKEAEELYDDALRVEPVSRMPPETNDHFPTDHEHAHPETLNPKPQILNP
jgi:tetratricopeptide (TPR) repeat protein